MPPGERVLLRIPSFAWSTAIPFESIRSPALVAPKRPQTQMQLPARRRSRCGALTPQQRRQKNENQPDIDPATEKTHRSRRRPPTAQRAAEAVPERRALPLCRKRRRNPPRLATVMRRMQNTPTVTTTRLPNLRRLTAVDLEQKIPNLANPARLGQHHSASNVSQHQRLAPQAASRKLLEGNSCQSIKLRDRNPPKPSQLSRTCSLSSFRVSRSFSNRCHASGDPSP